MFRQIYLQKNKQDVKTKEGEYKLLPWSVIRSYSPSIPNIGKFMVLLSSIITFLKRHKRAGRISVC